MGFFDKLTKKLKKGVQAMHLDSINKQLDMHKLFTDPKGYAKGIGEGYKSDLSFAKDVYNNYKDGNWKYLGQSAFSDTAKAFGASKKDQKRAGKAGADVGKKYGAAGAAAIQGAAKNGISKDAIGEAAKTELEKRGKAYLYGQASRATGLSKSDIAAGVGAAGSIQAEGLNSDLLMDYAQEKVAAEVKNARGKFQVSLQATAGLATTQAPGGFAVGLEGIVSSAQGPVRVANIKGPGFRGSDDTGSAPRTAVEVRASANRFFL